MRHLPEVPKNDKFGWQKPERIAQWFYNLRDPSPVVDNRGKQGSGEGERPNEPPEHCLLPWLVGDVIHGLLAEQVIY